MTISKRKQEWTLPAQLGQLKTGQDGKGLLRVHLWCPDDLPRLWDRIEWFERPFLLYVGTNILKSCPAFTFYP